MEEEIVASEEAVVETPAEETSSEEVSAEQLIYWLGQFVCPNRLN